MTQNLSSIQKMMGKDRLIKAKYAKVFPISSGSAVADGETHRTALLNQNLKFTMVLVFEDFDV
ncbi:hypothetical protein [Umezakia ovalisporum]|uniref:Uncharacterized protein n=2 Tax=Umezakia ovalisporum TaxID=75695 RepID=A0AA43GZW6_9CYAN|nr:hypothetical protein [Umezakia ovalisporum]MBI1241440.1 hypothetical protein [Nostoc sp. RI_552]MDH6058150.1 hypothetical protein [Umezakia ovalisporum FSS-43]MDH6064539.1 hypothetical protein [Umezakia ovalisporum FSS-62]MDH6073596.1 hypothetical protein [Umezakia ovalisporum CS-1034]MDH6079241.1 hypothetical protein [Umezakia ovalisporum FSS-45]